MTYLVIPSGMQLFLEPISRRHMLRGSGAVLATHGPPVLAAANPLRGVKHDSAYVAGLLKTITGPIVLVGHSYGGTVISNAATGNRNVEALVYVAAFARAPLLAARTVPGRRWRCSGSPLCCSSCGLSARRQGQ